jgi:hypothetical protein
MQEKYKGGEKSGGNGYTEDWETEIKKREKKKKQ